MDAVALTAGMTISIRTRREVVDRDGALAAYGMDSAKIGVGGVMGCALP